MPPFFFLLLLLLLFLLRRLFPICMAGRAKGRGKEGRRDEEGLKRLKMAGGGFSWRGLGHLADGGEEVRGGPPGWQHEASIFKKKVREKEPECRRRSKSRRAMARGGVNFCGQGVSGGCVFSWWLGEFRVPFEWRGGFWVAGGRWQGARCLVVVFFSGGWESFLFLLNGKRGFG